jgi:hypothetical protein
LARRCRCRVAYPVANDDGGAALTLAAMTRNNTGASGRESNCGGPIAVPWSISARSLQRRLDATARLSASMSVHICP